jgi:ParB-like chromosome segregation protein Spo0J
MTKIDCSYDELVKLENLIPHPRNNNRHPDEQIERLAKIIEATAWRNPIIVSRKSGFIVVGHARLEVAKRLGMKEVPVDYQDFENEAQEYQYLTSENAIARWSEIDENALKIDLQDLEFDLDLELLGLKDLVLENDTELEIEEPEDVDEGRNFIIKCDSIADFLAIQQYFDADNNKINFANFNKKVKVYSENV